MKLKVCGMRDPANILEIAHEIKPDFMGFIFYAGSKRFVLPHIEDKATTIYALPKEIARVGVFVNHPLHEVIGLVLRYKLAYVQLHGDEDVIYCKKLKAQNIRVIKVFRVNDTLPVSAIEAFSDTVDYFLFDTKASDYGGTGKVFDWSILANYPVEKPFLLSGGLNLQNIEGILKAPMPYLYGIDVNSHFEVEPGLKDLDALRALRKLMPKESA